jgi:hypothetical protein
LFFPTSLYSNLASNNVFESFKVGDNMLSLSLFLLNIIVLYVHFYSNQNMLLQRHHLFIFNDALLSPPILRENNNIFCTKHLLKYSNGCQYMQLALSNKKILNIYTRILDINCFFSQEINYPC